MTTRGRRSVRTRYRPDPWRLPEWLVAGSGGAAFGLVLIAGGQGLHPSTQPLEPPALPLLATAALLCGLLPAFTAPEPA